MSRDLADYQKEYADQPYEKYQVIFRRRTVKEILNNHSHDVILEVGCGLESIFLHLDSFVKMVVVEPSAAFFEKARQDKARQAANKDITIVNTTLEDIPDEVRNVKFDFILVSSLLHEISNPELFLRKIYELCHADTLVHINVPNAKSFHRQLAVEMGLIKSPYEASESNIKFQQRTVFDTDSLRHAVEEAGFAVDSSGAYSFKPFSHLQLQRMLDSQLISEETIDGFYAMGKYLPELCSEIYVNVVKNAKL